MNIVNLSPAAIVYLAEAATRADAEGRRLRVAFDAGTFKYKVGEGSWSVPFSDMPDPYRDAPVLPVNAMFVAAGRGWNDDK